MPIEPLNEQHDLSGFDCGILSLNTYLQRYARQNIRRNLGRTYVLVENGQILGYHSVSISELVGQIPGNLPQRVGVILLGRLAVALGQQGRGLGTELLIHSLRCAQEVAGIAGAQSVVVDVEPTNPGVKEFYEKHGFQETPNNPSRLYLTMEAVRELAL